MVIGARCGLFLTVRVYDGRIHSKRLYPDHQVAYVFMANNDQGHRFHESLHAFLVGGQEQPVVSDAAY